MPSRQAVNFAPPDWLPFGRNAAICARKHLKLPVFCVVRLLCEMAEAAAALPTDQLEWMLPELESVIVDEVKLRQAFRSSGGRLESIDVGEQAGPEPTCAVCKSLLFLSAVGHGPKGTFCLAHASRSAAMHAARGPHGWSRYTEGELRELCDKVAAEIQSRVAAAARRKGQRRGAAAKGELEGQ